MIARCVILSTSGQTEKGSVIEVEFPNDKLLPIEKRLTWNQVAAALPNPTTNKPRPLKTIKDWHSKGLIKGGFYIGETLYFDRHDFESGLKGK